MKRRGNWHWLFLLSFLPTAAWSQCGSGANVAVFSNYDGGYLTIDVSEDIADLKIGIVSYEPVNVTFVGDYVGNITEVVYAGYQPMTGTGNFHCDNNLATTSISPVPNGTITILNTPAATQADPNGNANIICAYSCDSNSGQGGCNTSDQIEAYFADYFGSNLLFHKTQYECWCGVQDLSLPATCCTPVNSSTGTAVNISASPGLICGTEPVVLDAGPGYDTYLWSTGATSQSITVSNPGVYSVDVENTCGTASDSYEVLLGANPAITPQITPNYGCIDGSISLSISNPGQSPAPHTFDFFGQGGNPVPSSGGSAADLAPGDYGCLITDANGCTTLFSFTIDQEEPVEIEASVTDASCAGGLGSAFFTMTFNVTDIFSYEVFDPTGATVIGGTVAGSTLEVQGLAPGLYILVVDGLTTGCMEAFNFTIGGASGFSLSSVVEDISCTGETDGSIEVEVDGINGPFNFVWEDSNGSVLGMESSLEGLSAGIYTALITDQGGCMTEVDYTILEPEPLELVTDLSETRCVDTMATLVALGKGGTLPYTYLLNDTIEQMDNMFFLLPGAYTLTLVDANGCSVQNDSIQVDPFLYPPIIIQASPDIDYQPLGEEFTLNLITTSEVLQSSTVSWRPSLLVDCDTCPSVNTSITKPTEFIATIKYDDGCIQIVRKIFFVEIRRRIYAPNVFKPDFDGVNDFFEIFPSLEIERLLSLQIFDRWGALVFSGEEGDALRWDGTINGERAASGVYSWVLNVLFIDGDYRIFSGDVILLR